MWDYSVNGHTIESRRWVGDFEGEDTAAPATDGTCNGPEARPLVFIAASHDRDPPLDPNASGSAAHSGGRPPTPPQPQSQPLQETPTISPTTWLEVSEQRSKQPPLMEQSQPLPWPPPARVRRPSPSPATPQPPPTTSPATRPPLPSNVTSPGQPVLAMVLPLTGMLLLTPAAVLALETSPQSASRPAQLPPPRTSRTTPGEAPEGRSSESASTPQSPPLPPRTVSPTPAENRQPREETPKDCCVCYKALAAPMVLLGSCPHRLHLPHYAALRVRPATDLSCPACRTTAPVEDADGRALRHHTEEVMGEVMLVARRERRLEEEGGHPPGPHGTGGEGE